MEIEFRSVCHSDTHGESETETDEWTDTHINFLQCSETRLHYLFFETNWTRRMFVKSEECARTLCVFVRS